MSKSELLKNLQDSRNNTPLDTSFKYPQNPSAVIKKITTILNYMKKNDTESKIQNRDKLNTVIQICQTIMIKAYHQTNYPIINEFALNGNKAQTAFIKSIFDIIGDNEFEKRLMLIEKSYAHILLTPLFKLLDDKNETFLKEISYTLQSYTYPNSNLTKRQNETISVTPDTSKKLENEVNKFKTFLDRQFEDSLELHPLVSELFTIFRAYQSRIKDITNGDIENNRNLIELFSLDVANHRLGQTITYIQNVNDYIIYQTQDTSQKSISIHFIKEIKTFEQYKDDPFIYPVVVELCSLALSKKHFEESLMYRMHTQLEYSMPHLLIPAFYKKMNKIIVGLNLDTHVFGREQAEEEDPEGVLKGRPKSASTHP